MPSWVDRPRVRGEASLSGWQRGTGQRRSIDSLSFTRPRAVGLGLRLNELRHEPLKRGNTLIEGGRWSELKSLVKPLH